MKSLSDRYEIAPEEVWNAVKEQCFEDGVASDGQMFMLLSFARQYDLNPLARECYAFISKKTGRMHVAVAVDGWTKIANREPNFDGQDLIYENDGDGKLIAIKAVTYVKNRSHPTVYRAVLQEWYRDTEVWRGMPSHQLFIKAKSQGIRWALGISAYDPDDIERIRQSETIETGGTPAVDADSRVLALTPSLASPAATTTVPPPAASSDDHSSNGAAGQPSELPPAASLEEDLEPEAENAPRGGKRGRKSKRERLDALIARHITAVRLNMILAARGVDRIEDLTDSQVAEFLRELETKFAAHPEEK